MACTSQCLRPISVSYFIRSDGGTRRDSTSGQKRPRLLRMAAREKVSTCTVPRFQAKLAAKKEVPAMSRSFLPALLTLLVLAWSAGSARADEFSVSRNDDA